MKCDRCGSLEVIKQNCKVMCTNCYARWDCSDTHILYTCIHFNCELDEACSYCENYKRCALHQGDLKFD